MIFVTAEEADVSFVWALKALRVERLLLEHILYEDMKYREFGASEITGNPSNRRHGRASHPKAMRAQRLH